MLQENLTLIIQPCFQENLNKTKNVNNFLGNIAIGKSYFYMVK